MQEQDYNIIFSKNLKYYLSINNITQAELASKLNVSATSVSNWCKGLKAPRMDKVDAMCSIFGCLRSDLISYKDRELTSNAESKGVSIPVLGHVAAGIPIEACEDIIDFEEIDIKLASTGTYFGLRIKGDSMEPKISDGDVVIIKKQNDADTGDVVIVTINGHEATCKRLRKYRDGVELIPNNPKYEPSFFGNDDIEKLPVKVIGRVVELRAKF